MNMNPAKYVLPLFVGCFLLLLSTGALLAQPCYGGSCYGGSAIPSNELGVRVGSLTDASTVGGAYSGNAATHIGFLNGIHYKRYQSRGAFRLQVGYTRYEIDEITDCPNCFRTDGLVQQVMFKAGYEWFTFFGPLEPYAGLDFAVGLGKYEGETFTYGTNPSDFMEYTDQRKKRGFGFAPVIGMRFYLSSYLSLGAETTFEAMLYNRDVNISNLNTDNSSIRAQRNKWEGVYHPVSWISLNVLF